MFVGLCSWQEDCLSPHLLKECLSLEIGEGRLGSETVRAGIAKAFCLGGNGPAAELLKAGAIHQSIKGRAGR